MGVWGYGIFDSDDALDVRETFRDLIGKGVDPKLASQQTIDAYCLGSIENIDNHQVDFALASVEHDLGIPDEYITGQALRIITSEEQLAHWGEDAPRRKKALQALHKKLLKDLPAPKEVPAPAFKDTPYTVGQHILFRDEKSGSRLLLRVVGHRDDTKGRYPRFAVLDWSGDQAGFEEPSRLLPLRIRFAIFKHQIYVGALIVGGRVKKANLTLLADTAVVESAEQYSTHFMRWADLVEHVRDEATSFPATLAEPSPSDSSSPTRSTT